MHVAMLYASKLSDQMEFLILIEINFLVFLIIYFSSPQDEVTRVEIWVLFMALHSEWTIIMLWMALKFIYLRKSIEQWHSRVDTDWYKLFYNVSQKLITNPHRKISLFMIYEMEIFPYWKCCKKLWKWS